jgi:hypothetical protein
MGPMGHPRVEIHTRPRPGLLRVRVWVHPRVRFDTHTRTQWVWHPRAPAPTGRIAIPIRKGSNYGIHNLCKL